MSPPNTSTMSATSVTPTTPHPVNALQTALQQAWAQRQARERRLLSLGATVLLLAALWSWAWAPAWRTWQEAPAKQARLDAQTQDMRQLQAQAQSLQKPNPITRSESVQWLENNLAELGANAKISLQGERATLSVDAAPAQAMARWIGLARERALALPVQAQLQTAASPDAPGLLRGTVVLRLP